MGFNRMKIDVKVFFLLFGKIAVKNERKYLLQNAFIVVHGWGNKLSFMFIPFFLLFHCFNSMLGLILELVQAKK